MSTTDFDLSKVSFPFPLVKGDELRLGDGPWVFIRQTGTVANEAELRERYEEWKNAPGPVEWAVKPTAPKPQDVQSAAVSILDLFHYAERDLMGASVAMFDGETGTVTGVKLDEFHGICFTVDRDPHLIFRDSTEPVRWRPVSTIARRA